MTWRLALAVMLNVVVVVFGLAVMLIVADMVSDLTIRLIVAAMVFGVAVMLTAATCRSRSLFARAFNVSICLSWALPRCL